MSQDRRIIGRVPVAVAAICRREGESWEALVCNISHGGCCVELPFKVLERGDRIALEIGDDLQLPATVAWSGTKRAGLAFASPLYAEMIEELAEQQRKAA